MVDIALSNTDRLARLVNDILDIERIESGAVSLDRRDTDVTGLVAQAMDLIHPMADKRAFGWNPRFKPRPCSWMPIV